MGIASSVLGVLATQVKMSQQYFKIFGGASGKVLDASRSNVGEVVLWESNNGNNQLWYWDGPNRDNLRNKEFPNRVLDFHWDDYQRNHWGKVYLHQDFHNGWNQRWEMHQGEIICKGSNRQTIPNLRLDVFAGETHNGAKVGVYQRNGAQNQSWRFQEERRYFYIRSLQSAKVLDASLSNVGEVCLWQQNGQDNQLWFWDGHDILRNKRFPNKVLDFHWHDYQRQKWGKVYLHEKNNGWNQKWQMNGREIACRGFQSQAVPNLRLDVFGSSTHNGAKVGVYQRSGGSNQDWAINMHN